MSLSKKEKGREEKGRGLMLDVRKKFFPMTVVWHWNMLPREVMYAPFLKMFGWGFDQPGLVSGIPVHSRVVGNR